MKTHPLGLHYTLVLPTLLLGAALNAQPVTIDEDTTLNNINASGAYNNSVRIGNTPGDYGYIIDEGMLLTISPLAASTNTGESGAGSILNATSAGSYTYTISPAVAMGSGSAVLRGMGAGIPMTAGTRPGGAFYMNGVDVSAAINLTNVTLENYAVLNSGGAIYANGGAFSFDFINVNFLNNSGTDNNNIHGGAIYLNAAAGSDSTLVMNGGAFSGNSISGTRSATATAYGGAMHAVNASLDLNNVVFENNNASAESTTTRATAWGGALYANSSSVVMNDVTFKGNAVTGVVAAANTRATAYGGAIYFGENSGTLIINSGIFTSNTARAFSASSTGYAHGGAIYITSATLTVGSSEFSYNVVTGSAGSRVYAYGGAIYSDGASLLIINSSTFSNNSADADSNRMAYGGALHLSGADNVSRLTDVVFKENTARDYGGAIYMTAAAGTFNGITFTSNTANYGGAIYSITSTSLVLNNALFSSNTANYGGAYFGTGGAAIYVNSGTFKDNLATANDGGAVFISSAAASGTFIDVWFSNNTSGKTGGAFYLGGGEAHVKSSTFSNNAAATGGGAIYMASGILDASDSIFDKNTATTSGGALYVASTALMTATAAVFGTNASISPATNNTGGGAIYVSSATIDVSLSSFEGNYAVSNGGAIYGTGAQITATGALFKSNTAVNYNGGAIVGYSASVINIDSGTFVGNYSGGSGGAVYMTGGTTFAGNAHFEGNTANGSSGGGALLAANAVINAGSATFKGNTALAAYGGAVYATGGEFNAEGSRFEGNVAYGSANTVGGGAIMGTNGATLNLASAVFISNTALDAHGGAVYVRTTSALNAEGAYFSGNASGRHGGAIYVSTNASADVSSGTFTGNASTNQGGAIHVGTNSTLTASYGVFTGNVSEGHGGALYVGSNNSVDISSGTFTGNASISHGGAVYVATSSTLNASGAVFSGNTSATHGAAIYAVGIADTLNLTDAVFLDNTSTNGRGGAVFVATREDAVTSVLIGASSTGTSLYSGNTAKNSGGANSFTFSSSGTFDVTVSVADGGLLDMRDPLATDTSSDGINQVFQFAGVKTGVGEWRLGGNNVVSGSLGNSLNVNQGMLSLYSGASLTLDNNTADNLDVFTLGSGATLKTFSVDTSGAASAAGAVIMADTITFEAGSIISYDLAQVNAATNTALLTLTAPTLGIFTDVSQNAFNFTIDLSTWTSGSFNLLSVGAGNLSGFDAAALTALVDTLTYNGAAVLPAGYKAASFELKGDNLWLVLDALANRVLYWTGGDGIWDATTANWYPNTNYTPAESAPWLTGDLAIFERAGGGRVTVSDNIILSGLQFDATGYTLAGAGALVGNSGSLNINVKPGVTTTIETAIRTATLQKYGDGSLTLSGGITATGDFHLTLDGSGTLVLSGNNTATSGGAIYADGLDSITIGGNHGFLSITSNTAAVNGGALRTQHGDVTITATTGDFYIEENHAGTYGGAITANGDIVIGGITGGTLAISGNTAGLAGGALYSGTGNIRVTGSHTAISISANAISDPGGMGGGAFEAAKGAIIIDADTVGVLNIASNLGRYRGGALNAAGSVVIGGTHSDIIITSNTSTYAAQRDAVGGAIFSGGDITISATSGGAFAISNNYADLRGGAFNAGSGSILVEGKYDGVISISNNTAAGANAIGGAFYARDDITLDTRSFTTLVSANYSGTDGGAFVSASGGISIGGHASNLVIVDNRSQHGSGGAFYARTGGITITTALTGGVLSISNNNAALSGGAFYAAGNILIDAAIDVAPLIITGNTAATTEGYARGGAFYSGGKITISGSYAKGITIANNSAISTDDFSSGQGGAFYAGGDISINASSSGTLAIRDNIADDPMFGSGGALYSRGNIVIGGAHDGILIASNTSMGTGGAFDARYDITISATTANALEITGNRTHGAGAALYSGLSGGILLNGKHSAILVNSNTANYAGGAFYAKSGITIGATTGGALEIVGNFARADASSVNGGAFYGGSGDITLNGRHAGGILIASNTALSTASEGRANGGAFHTSYNILLGGDHGGISITANNTQDEGGAFYANRNITISATTAGALEISGNSAASNHASLKGGAFYSGGNITISGSYGGGITIADNTVSTTHATGTAQGGAFYAGNDFTLNLADDTTFTVTNNLAADNASGGFLYVNSGSIHFNIGQSSTATIGAASSAANAADSIAAGNAGVIMTKTGAGTLILNSDNSAFTGTTAVNAGRLVLGAPGITSARLGGLVNVNANATLLGAGSVANITVHSGGTLAPALGSALQPFSPSALRVGDTLTLHGGANVNYNLFAGSTASTITADTLVLNASSADRINIHANTAITGTYILVDAAQTIAAFGDDWFNTIFGDGTGSTLVATYTRDNASNDLILTLALALQNTALVWTGSTNTTWDATVANWSGRATGQFAPGDRVTIGSGGAGDSPVLISIIAGGVQVADILVTGDQNVTLAGGRVITGTTLAHTTLPDATGKLVKTGTGTLDFTGIVGENDFIGGVALGGGALRISSAGQLGTTLSNLRFTGTGALFVADDVTFDGASGTTQRITLNTGQSAVITTETGKTLTIQNNATAINGGALHNNGGDVGMVGVLFASNTASGAQGGALYNTGTLSVTGARFENNHTGEGGGALFNNGAVATITSATFTGNTAAAYKHGGAIQNTGASGTLALADSVFVGNSAGNSGGAIYNTGARVTGSNLSFTANTAQWGGAVYNNNGTLTFVSSTFTENWVKDGGGGGAIFNYGNVTLTGTGLVFVSNTAVQGSAQAGAAIYNQGGTLALVSSTFTGNIAGSSGGAIHNNGGHITGAGLVFTSNTARGTGGGALFATAANSTVTLADSSFSGNYADSNGGAVNVGNKITLSGSTDLANNRANGDSGGGVYAGLSLVVAGTLTGSGNYAGASGGALYSGSSIDASGASLVFSSNTAGYRGGAIYTVGGISIGNDSSFTENHASESGGAIYTTGTRLGIGADTVFSGNSAGLDGGAIALAASDFTLNANGAVFTGNTARRSGGAIARTPTLSASSTINIQSARFENNAVIRSDGGGVSGGAVGISGTGVLNAQGAVFTSNSASTTNETNPGLSGDAMGGAVFVQGSTADLSTAVFNLQGATFSDNVAFASGGADAVAEGGAVSVLDGTLNLQNAVFERNAAISSNLSWGGAFAGSVSIINAAGARFTGNMASVTGAGAVALGGAINYAATYDGGDLTQGGILDVTDAVFTGNSAVSANGIALGGAITVSTGTLYLGATSTGTSRFAGNTMTGLNTDGTAAANSIYFLTGIENGITAQVRVDAGGLLDMQDAMAAGYDSDWYDPGEPPVAATLAITKTGGGEWRLSGSSILDGSQYANSVLTPNVHTVAFAVNEGTLRLTQGAAIKADAVTSIFSLAANTTLSLTGGNSISAQTMALDSGAIITMDLAAANTITSLLTLNATTLNAGGWSQTLNLLNIASLTAASGDLFGLITLGNGNLFTAADLTALQAGVTGLAADYSLVLSSDYKTLQLQYLAQAAANRVLAWKGLESGNWLVDENWSTGLAFQQGDIVNFDGTTAAANLANNTIALATTATIAGMYVSGDQSYAITGAGIVADSTVGTLSGSAAATGKLVLGQTVDADTVTASAAVFTGTLDLTGQTGANDFAGGVEINTGALRISSTGQLGTTLSNLNVTGTGSLIAGAGASMTFDDGGAGTTQRLVIATGVSGTLHAEADAAVTIANNVLDIVPGSLTGGAALHVEQDASFAVSAADGAKIRLTGNSSLDGSESYNIRGGAIFNAGTLSLANVEIDHNTSPYYAGAIYNAGRLDIAGSFIHDNTSPDAEGSFGGAIITQYGYATIASSTLSGNVSTFVGGAIYVNRGGTLALNDVLFASNTTGAAGGGAIMIDGDIGAHGAATVLTGANVRFDNNYSDGIGGAIRNNSDSLDLTGFEFTGNRAGTQGGAIHNGYVTTLESGTFKNNVSVAEGGAIYNLGGQADLTLTDILFVSNTASEGGAIYLGGGTLAVTSATFANNTASGQGGAIYNAAAAAITSATFTGNTAAAGAALYNTGSLFLAGVEIAGNTATDFAAAIYNTAGGNITAENVRIHGNRVIGVESGAGALALALSGRSFTTIVSSTISGNSANHVGGAVWLVNGSTLTLNDVTLSGNHAANGGNLFGGGAIMVEQDYTGGPKAATLLTGTNLAFDSNTADGGGGALANNRGVVDLASFTFTNNTSGSNGGAIFTGGANVGDPFPSIVTLASGTFDNNTATLGSGGAIFNNAGGHLTLADVAFTNNSAADYGGAIHIATPPAAPFVFSIAGGLSITSTGNTAGIAGGFLYLGGASAIEFNVGVSATHTIGAAADTAADTLASQNAAAVINKTGAGALILNAASTGYLGATNINAGSLVLGNASAALGGALAVNNTGTLAGNGSAGSVTVATGGAVQVGLTHADSSVTSSSTLSLSALNIGAGSTLYYDLYSGGQGDRIDVTGAVSFLGTGTLVLNAWQSGTYTLITADAISYNTFTLALTGTDDFTGRQAAYLDQLATEINLVFNIFNKNITWTNLAGDYAWSTTSTNWNYTDPASTNDAYLAGDHATFVGASLATPSEITVTGLVEVAGMTVSGGTLAFTGGTLASTTETTLTATSDTTQRLAIGGGAEVTLGLATDFAKGVTLADNSTLVLGHDRALGTFLVNLSDPADSAGQLTVLDSGTVQTNASLAVASRFVVADSATLALAPVVDTTLAINGINVATRGLDGGAINLGTNSMLSHTGGTLSFDGNRAVRGGAIYSGTGSTLALGDGALFTSNTASASGGAIHAETTVTLGDNARFDANYAAAWGIATGGGAIYSGGDVTLGDGALFASNTATSSLGGAIYTRTDLAILGSATLAGNYAGMGGGAVYLAAGSIIIGGTATFSDNVTNNGQGGAIYASSGSVGIEGDAIFTSNTASAQAGAIYSGSGVTILGSATFADNRAGAPGGAIDAGNGSVNIGVDAVFTNNTAGAPGGAIYAGSGSVAIGRDAVFTSNTATSGPGGAIYAAAGVSIVGSATFADNYATANGGAIYTDNGSVAIGVDAVFSRNISANAPGGAIMAYTDVTILGSATFANNYAGAPGGAIYAASGSVAIGGDAMFVSNTAGGSGGAIAAHTNVTILGSATFTDNYATGPGGAINVADGSVTIAGDAAFTRNISVNAPGGAIYTVDAVVIDGDAVFMSNTATYPGGAIYALEGVSIAGSATFNNNYTGDAGGAIFAGDIVILGSATFTGNYSGVHGGAIYSIGDITLNEAAFTGNTADELGGAIFNEGNALTLNVGSTGTTLFTGNTDQAGANSIHHEATSWNDATMIVNVADGGLLDMRDRMTGTASGANSIAISSTGAGVWKLGGANEFAAVGTGGVTLSVTAGALHLYGASEVADVVAGSLNLGDANSAFTLGNTATLSLGGANAITANALNFNNGSTICFASASGAGDTLALTGDATFTGATIQTRLGASASQVDLIAIDGDASFLTTTSTIAVNYTGALATGTYTLLTADAINYNSLTLALTGTDDFSARQTGSLIQNTTTLDLVLNVLNKNITWTNLAGDYAWSTTSTNWSFTDTPATSDAYLAGDHATFTTGTGTINVAGRVEVAGMTVTGGTLTFTGGTIASTPVTTLTATSDTTQKLAIAAAADMTLAATIDFANGLENAGRFTLADSGSITANMSIANTGTFAIDRAADYTLANTVAGTGDLIKAGSGVLTLTATNTYTGLTRVTGGELVNAGNILNSDVNVTGGLFTNTGTLFTTLANASASANTGNITGVVTNTGTLTNVAGGTLAMLVQTSGTATNAGLIATATINGGGLANNDGNITTLVQTAGIAANAGLVSTVTLAATGTLVNSATIATLAQTGGTMTNAATGTIALATTTGNLTNAGAIDQLTQTAGYVDNAGLIMTALVNGGTLASTGGTMNGATIGTTGALLFNSGTLAAITNNGALTYANAAAYTQSAAITGAGAIAKTGAGDLTLAALVEAAALDIAAGKLTVANTGTLSLTGALNIAATSTLGVAIGSGTSVIADSVNFNDTGKLDITGYTVVASSSYTAPTDVARTVIHTTGGGILGFSSSNVTILNQTAVDYLKVSATATADDIIIDTMLAWNLADGTAHGTYDISSATFTIAATLADNDGAHPGWDGKSLTKLGAGTLVLSASNAHTGTTTISAGILENTGYIAGALVNVVAGELVNSGTIATAITNAATTTNTGRITGLATNTALFANNALGNITGTLANTGTLINANGAQLAMLVQAGSGTATNAGLITTATLNGGGFANTGTATTLVQTAGTVDNAGIISTATISGGALTNSGTVTTLAQQNGAATNTGLVTTAVQTGGLLTNAVSGSIATATVNGGTLSNTGGAITAAATIGANGTLLFNSGTMLTAITNDGRLAYANADAYTQSNAITGTGAIAKTGAGDLNIAALVENTALDIATGKLTVAETGTLNLSGSLNIAATSTLGIMVGAGTSVIADSVNFNDTGVLDITGYTVVATSTYPFDPTVARTVIHTTGNSILGFNAANVTISGTTEVDYLKVSAYATAADIIIDTMLSWNLADGTAHGNVTIASGQTFTIDAALVNNTTAHPGWDGASLTKLGEGTLILAGENTHTGTTTIATGTLTNTGIIAGALVNVIADTALINTGTITADALLNNATLANASTGAIANLAQAAGTTTNAGLVTTATITGGALMNTGNVTNAALVSGTLANNAGATIAALNQTGGSATNAGLITSATTSGGLVNATGTIATLAQTGGLVTNNAAITTAATINGGTLANTGGIINVAATIGANGTLLFNSGSLAAPITNNGALTFANTAAYTLDQVVSGAGVLNKNGSGNLIIAVAQTYTGATNINTGALRLATDNALAASNRVSLAAAATLDLGGRNQNIKTLAAADTSRVVFNSIGTNYTTLRLATLAGSGTFAMRVDSPAEHDTLVITGNDSTGAHTIDITLGGALRDPVPLVEISAASAATFHGEAEYNLDLYTIEQADNGHWQLSTGGVSDTGDVILSTAGVIGMDWHYSLDSVHLRMGDLRSMPAAGRGSIWMRTSGYRLNGSPNLPGDTFRQHTWNVTAGGDAVISAAESIGTIIVGGFIQMGRSDRTYDNFGKSDTDTVGAGLYATALLADGWFADATLKYDRYSNDLDARDTNAVSTTADYNTKIFGLSIEAGRRITLTPDSRYWFEPSAQVATAWIGSADYTARGKADIDVKVGSSNIWQYRAQIRAGANMGRWIPYIKIAGVGSNTSGGKVHADDRAYEVDLDGFRFETGFGASYLITPASQLYFDYEYNKSSKYERPWAINLGYRLIW